MAAEVGGEVKIDDFLCRWSCDDSWEELGLLFDLEGDLLGGGGLGTCLLSRVHAGEGHVPGGFKSADDPEEREGEREGGGGR